MKLLQKTLVAATFALLVGVLPSAAFAQSYPYAYTYYQNPTPQPLVCTATVNTVRAGETVTFTATGGWSNIYNWATPERTYLNSGPQLTVALFTPGSHSVVVSAGPQTAACSITVLAPLGNTNPVVQQPTYPVTYFTSQYIPNLPNTGFAPLTTASFGFALVLLVATALFVSPYVKRTLASTFR